MFHTLFIRAILPLSALVLLMPGVASSANMDQQRQTFKQALQMAQKGDSGWRAKAAGITDYPLYPWLEGTYLDNRRHHESPQAIKAYLDKYHDLPPAYDLRHRYLLQLAKDKNWSAYRRFYKPGINDNLGCYELKARLADGQTLDFDKDLADLWQKPNLPNSCDSVQSWAHQHGLLTSQRLWSRIDSAIKARQGGTVASLAKWLPGNQQASARHIAEAIRNPTAAASQMTSWPNNAREREAMVLAMTQLSRKSTRQAQQAWQRVKAKYDFSTAQRHEIEASIALYDATSFSDRAYQHLAQLPTKAHTDSTREWWLRNALVRQDWQQAMRALNTFSAEQRQQGEWRYWRARTLEKLGHKDEANKLYSQQAKEATYYGFLAADRLNKPYSICPRSIQISDEDRHAVARIPYMEAAFELEALHRYYDARRMWAYISDKQSPHMQQVAAAIAYQRGWYHPSIRTFSYGDLLKMYAQRFPLAPTLDVPAHAREAGVDPAWAYAIIRAESAWMVDAHSGADARGLMQLLPGTASLIAKQAHLPYNGNLYDAKTNITLGTHYLAHVANRFQGAPFLATAAYNAGPGRVDQWLTERGNLPADIFIATIPFYETRGYVMRVLAYSVIYDWLLNTEPKSLLTSLPRKANSFIAPPLNTPHKSVVCSQ